ncbi:MAG: hypothetical protein KR126chlam3_00427, partial [Chlamydiae bacterium]|nr:hypothetical protein [Chlamydiota bacterium]
FSVLKYLGAAYLFYLGLMLLKEKVSQQVALANSPLNPASNVEQGYLQKKPTKPFVSGFLCNLLNPKATLFMLSLFSQFIDPSSSVLEKIGMGSVVASVGFVWFVILSYLLTHRLLRRHFARFQLVITKMMGIVLCILAVYIAFVSN